ncbi:MAG: RNA polymerase sigma factor [Nannocystaceae bacterium]|nr:RNA polymerase sigma factor [Nannocystaceae bacterium]
MSGTLTWPMVATLDADPIALLAAVRRGDAAAQAEFFENNKDAVARQVMRMTGDAGWVDDLVQEVFIAAFSRLGSFRGDAAVETWLHRITVNKVRNAWDSRRRRIARESEAVRPEASVHDAPDDGVAAAEQLRRFYIALGILPAKYRDAFVCRAIEELSLEDTSAELGVPVSTVSYRARRAEVLLAEALQLEARS